MMKKRMQAVLKKLMTAKHKHKWNETGQEITDLHWEATKNWDSESGPPL